MSSKRNNQVENGDSGDDEYDDKEWDTDEEEDLEGNQGESIDEDDSEPSDDDEEEEEEEEEEDDDDDGKIEEFDDEDEATKSPYEENEKPPLANKDSEWEEGRGKLVPIMILICCCCCIIIGIIVGVVVFPLDNNDDSGGPNPSSSDSSPSDQGGVQGPTAPVTFPTPPPQPLTPSSKPPPTDFPTLSPSPTLAPNTVPTPQPSDYPTVAPTISMAPSKTIPEILGIIPDQDTTVYLDGFFIGEAYGSDDTFLVQHGLAAKEEVPDVISLITFPLIDVPSYDRLTTIKKNAILRLYHQVTTAERGSATYTLVRLPETEMAVESFHGYFFKPPDNETEAVVGPSFTVNPEDVVVDIDITSLLFDNQQEDGQLFLMLQDRGPEQPEGGDRFYSRESVTPPQLLIDFTGGNAADIPTPSQPDDVNGTIAPGEDSTDGPIGVEDDSSLENNSTETPISNRTGNETSVVEPIGSPNMVSTPSATPAPSLLLDDNVFNTSDDGLKAETAPPSASSGSPNR